MQATKTKALAPSAEELEREIIEKALIYVRVCDDSSRSYSGCSYESRMRYTALGDLRNAIANARRHPDLKSKYEDILHRA